MPDAQMQALVEYLIDIGLWLSSGIAILFGIFMLQVWHTAANKMRSNQRGKVVLPPGHSAFVLLSFLFSKKTFDSVFAQAIEDLRSEYAEALAQGNIKKARWIVCRDHGNLLLTVALHLAVSIGKRVIQIWKLVP